MATAQNLTGDALTRFVVASSLLAMIDQVRGEATVHTLDKHPHDGAWKLDNLQKKFLDSFALICSTAKQGHGTASAVCLEQGHPSGTILRLARNLGATQDLVDRLREVLDCLATVSQIGRATPAIEAEVLLKVVSLDREKILYLLEKLARKSVKDDIDDCIERMNQDDSFLEEENVEAFKDWVVNLPVIASLDANTDSSVLIQHIKWASQARWVHSEQLESLLLVDGSGELPRWLNYIYKLGRYFAAAKAMLKFASKQPDLFNPIHVELLEAPQPVDFFLEEDQRHLSTVLKRLNKDGEEQLMERLGQVWLTKQPESLFHKKCQHKLTVHAEMQLLSFYERYPELTPRLLFMGTSKKACFLCNEFLTRHPLRISVSACHQKIYPSWMPAPCSSAVRKENKVLLWELSRHLEATAARDLETRLGVRRPTNFDSTAGPSLASTSYLAS